MFQSLTLFMSFSVFSSSLSRPKMESTNSHPALRPMVMVAGEPPRAACSRLAAFHMKCSQALSNLLKRAQSRSPDSRKSSTISRASVDRMSGAHSSARLTLPASLMRSSQRSPATSAMGAVAPWWKAVQS
ncbi:uncharacterized protein TERG_11716 [Trichophyton rubrum CBS 118892]|uniref:Secreted protein n=1 Tax=Trichophyton rubrum (strain ATCC MYA-4607 / CBS 118892) TaxID=559305 RepID=A0A080WIZ4_TRIRC|nr:uncharacterized protein TERG_11716 [Trichophyton rubrum CBS 118892]KFL60597.1 hypothetical protein TERG_11716 [Trichophyton rubrum CBS 118892]